MDMFLYQLLLTASDNSLYSEFKFLTYSVISFAVSSLSEPVTNDESSHLASNVGTYIV